jgi:hypothetical protein
MDIQTFQLLYALKYPKLTYSWKYYVDAWKIKAKSWFCVVKRALTPDERHEFVARQLRYITPFTTDTSIWYYDSLIRCRSMFLWNIAGSCNSISLYFCFIIPASLTCSCQSIGRHGICCCRCWLIGWLIDAKMCRPWNHLFTSSAQLFMPRFAPVELINELAITPISVR